MTGLEALQALRDGKKVTNANMRNDYKAVVLTFETQDCLLTRIAWVNWDVSDEDFKYALEFSINFDGTDFLKDDWEIVE